MDWESAGCEAVSQKGVRIGEEVHASGPVETAIRTSWGNEISISILVTILHVLAAAKEANGGWEMTAGGWE
jgi:hypothetical protein